MSHTLREIEDKLLNLHLETFFRKAYEQGVADGRKQFSRPELLTLSDLQEMFQIKYPTVLKMTANPEFPRSTQIKARFPRDQVYKWIEENSNWVKENTNYYSKEAM
ncbi:helix-turn-helix transcriptional regulator [Cytobacillus kochii]|uniref:helix-turn-helix transcriptional regulator n=1 Tax=Cytobacillus kochii TaxID=859143 RepID=UPI002041037F|nr:helix-turn-helix domain-containing protein [Cytobacillus kochii]MCM3324273.1 helix-turn-helix domain-containing protein [Cytobacillus kochii]MCM3346659.1 helix-turn-helix domain-containing protein [Cytobacillus kochii]